MSACGMGGLRRVSSGGQLSLGEHSLRRTTSCGAFLSTGPQQGEVSKRDLLLGVLSMPLAAGVAHVGMACTQPSTGEPGPAANVGTSERHSGINDESIAIIMDAMACMSTLYGHTSQHLREVRITNLLYISIFLTVAGVEIKNPDLRYDEVD